MAGSFGKTKESIQRKACKKANNKISSRNKAIAAVETIVTLLFYYHRQLHIFFSLLLLLLFDCVSPFSWARASNATVSFSCVHSNIDNCFVYKVEIDIVGCSVVSWMVVPFTIYFLVHLIFVGPLRIVFCMWMRTLHQTNRRCTNKNIIPYQAYSLLLPCRIETGEKTKMTQCFFVAPLRTKNDTLYRELFIRCDQGGKKINIFKHETCEFERCSRSLRGNSKSHWVFFFTRVAH